MSYFEHSCRWAAVLLVAGLLSACATPSQTLQLEQNPPAIPAKVELESVPFYAQRDYQCGPAALATVINFHRIQTTPEQLLPLVYIPELKGTLQVEMLAATKQFERLAIQQDGKLESILREVANGNPILVMQNLGLEAYPFWHYAVVIGYDLQKQQIILRSGEIKRLIRPFSVFERTWERSDYWSVVVVPPDVMPVTANQDQFIKAAIALESSTSTESALIAYQTGLNRWPENYILQMGLGNVSYVLRDYSLSENAFIAATLLQSDRPEAWNNLAYARAKQGKKKLAFEAIEQALKLAPGNEEYKNSKIEIKNFP